MRKHFYARRDDADAACEVLRDFGLQPFIAMSLLDDLEQWEVCISGLPAAQPSADLPRIEGLDPYEDDWPIESPWWDEYRPGRRRDDKD